MTPFTAQRKRSVAPMVGLVRPPNTVPRPPKPVLPGGVPLPPGPNVGLAPRPTLPRPSIQPPIMPETPGRPPVPPPSIQPPIVPGSPPNLGPVVQPDTGPLTTFGPGNDLRDQQINPLASNRLTGVQGMVDAAGRAIGGGPSLSDAAAQQFKLLGEQSAEQRQLGIRDIGQGAARLGRIGAGMTTNQLTSLEDLLRTREEQARSGLSADVAQGEAGNRRANLAALTGLEGQQYGQEQGQRGELRGERGYQADTAQNAIQNRVQQRLLEEQLLNSGFGRGLDSANLGLRGSELYSTDAAQSGEATQALLTELGRAAAKKKRTAAGQPVTDAGYNQGYG
jgi:hypothetical protein